MRSILVSMTTLSALMTVMMNRRMRLIYGRKWAWRQGQSWQGDGGERYPTEYPVVPEPVNYRARHAGRHAPDRTGAPNGKCLTRVYQMGRHDAVSVISSVIASSSSSSSVKCDDSLGCRYLILHVLSEGHQQSSIHDVEIALSLSK